MNLSQPPFHAALFDLDGTLLDSGYVWRDVDAKFFAGRQVEVDHAEYARAVQGLSFREAAVYTKRRYDLPESVEAIMGEWMAMAREAYAHHVNLKPGARSYLRQLKRAGVKLAVVTANRAELFMPALERHGLAELFDAFCTSAEVGNVNKSDGAIYRLAAQRLGVAPEACAVFEDVLEGVAGAKGCGMRVYAIEDAAAEHHRETIAALADGSAADFTGWLRPDEPPRRCVIFTARCEGDLSRAYAPRPGDYVLCADGGWQLARAMGVRPDRVIGDFDSSDEPAGERTERVPVEKDDTDTMLCLKRGLALGFEAFRIVGGFGGRLDHTLANLQTLHYAALRGARAEMADGRRWATAIYNEGIRIPADVLGGVPAKLSVLSLTDESRGVTIRGAKYPLENGTLTNAFPLGMGNDFAAEAVEIAVAEGVLLVTACGE